MTPDSLAWLFNRIHQQTDLATFHGPEAEDQLITRPYALAEFQQIAMTPQPQLRIGAPPAFSTPDAPAFPAVVTLVPGRARGTGWRQSPDAVGLIGAPFEPVFAGKILVLESYGEDIYRAGMYHMHPTRLTRGDLLPQPHITDSPESDYRLGASACLAGLGLPQVRRRPAHVV